SWSRPASARPLPRAATRSGSPRRRRRLRPAPIFSWSGGRSSRRRIRAVPQRPSSRKLPPRHTHEDDMAKGFWIARVDVHDDEGYKPYVAANAAIFKKFGGRFLVRGGKFECPEGSSRSRNIVIEFPDYATALACYRSPEYQQNIKVRQPHAVADLIVIEGYDGPQPADQ